MRRVLKDHSVDPSVFRASDFDPKNFDPLAAYIAWEKVKSDVIAVFKKQYGLEEAPEVELCVRKPAKERDPHRLVFRVSAFEGDARKKIVSALAAALGMDKVKNFPDVVAVTETLALDPAKLKDKYLANGTVNSAEIKNAMVEVIQDELAKKGYKLSATPTKIDETTYQILSSATRIEAKIADNYVYFWRFHIRVFKDEDKLWVLMSRVDIGEVPVGDVRDSRAYFTSRLSAMKAQAK